MCIILALYTHTVHIYILKPSGGISVKRCRLAGIRISIIKIRTSRDRLIVIMGIPMPELLWLIYDARQECKLVKNLFWQKTSVEIPEVLSQIARFMGPTWGPPGSCRPQMGPMLAPWTLLSGIVGPIGGSSLEDMSSTRFLGLVVAPCCDPRVTLLRQCISRGYPAKRTLSAMRKHGG